MNILLFNIYLTSWTPRLCILMYCISLAGREKKVNQPLLWVKTCYEMWVVIVKRKVAAFPSRHILRMETICKYWKRLAIFTSSLSPVRKSKKKSSCEEEPKHNDFPCRWLGIEQSIGHARKLWVMLHFEGELVQLPRLCVVT